jgi:MoxR-like ATPase
VAEYALSTNLYTYAQARVDPAFFGWPVGTGEAEVIQQLNLGDVLIPKFSASATWAGGDESELDWQKSYCTAIGLDYDEVRAAYEAEIAGGEGGVPFLLRVIAKLPNDERQDGAPWARVQVEKTPLSKPLSSKEFLLLRALPANISAQFKGAVARGRHLQELPDGVVAALKQAAAADDRTPFLRQYSVVEANSAVAAVDTLKGAGRAVAEGDRVFIASSGGLLGVHDVQADGSLQPVGPPIHKTPDELRELFEEAKSKARQQDQFAPNRVITAAKELKELLDGPSTVFPIDDFGRFHDRYTLLASKVTQALEIASRPSTGTTPPGPEPEDEDSESETESEVDELAALQGLTIDAVRQQLPDGMVLPDEVLAEAVTALRSGKHLLLGGPPGTGKSTLAEALCRAVVGLQYDVVTATADWTTFDTIGGYMPTAEGALRFEPGVVLRCLQRGRWLTIDELNRADIDKAFGPLFTLLAGAGGEQPNRRVVLPFQTPDSKNVEVRWAETRSRSSAEFVLTPGWRLIGTLNLSDKATLFQLSFAFLRRFAVLDVPLPPFEDYRTFFTGLCAEVDEDERTDIVEAAMALAFGPRHLGPAILQDVANFMVKGLAETASGTPNYTDPVDAFATAVRLFAVPQYEGADGSDVVAVLKVFKDVWPERPPESWASLTEALDSVALS